MSRIGKQPIAIPAGVKVAVEKGVVKVEGPKGKLSQSHPPEHEGESDGKQITVKRPDDERQNRALHGLTRALINNMVVGVTKGYEKKLKIEGVGFQAAAKGKGVELTVGFANRIVHNPPGRDHRRGPRPDDDRGERRGQAEGRPVRRRDPRQPQARTVQGQGRAVRERSRPPQGRQVLRGGQVNAMSRKPVIQESVGSTTCSRHLTT